MGVNNLSSDKTVFSFHRHSSEVTVTNVVIPEW